MRKKIVNKDLSSSQKFGEDHSIITIVFFSVISKSLIRGEISAERMVNEHIL